MEKLSLRKKIQFPFFKSIIPKVVYWFINDWWLTGSSLTDNVSPSSLCCCKCPCLLCSSFQADSCFFLMVSPCLLVYLQRLVVFSVTRLEAKAFSVVSVWALVSFQLLFCRPFAWRRSCVRSPTEATVAWEHWQKHSSDLAEEMSRG